MFRRNSFFDVYKREPALLIGMAGLMVIGLMTLRSIASDLFPSYFIYIFAGLLVFILFSHLDFDILTLFSKHLYFLSLLSLTLPLIIGEVTRGAARWIQIGSITIQPTELIRPFLILFFAAFLVDRKLNLRNIILSFFLLAIPIILILIQPSLGVAVLTMAGFGGVVMSLRFNKKILLLLVVIGLLLSPIFWIFLAPYQRVRVMTLLSPASDPTGAGYNSIQSMIAVGSGQVTGRGLGEGVQTQLYFLPERHSDFIFASVAEELGFVGASLLIIMVFFVMYRIIVILENAKNPVARAFAAGVFTTLFLQIVIHIGMNMGLLPITGQPLPLVSAGGSSLIATMAMFGILMQVKREKN